MLGRNLWESRTLTLFTMIDESRETEKHWKKFYEVYNMFFIQCCMIIKNWVQQKKKSIYFTLDIKGADLVGTAKKSNYLGFFLPHIKIINNKCFSTWKICISRRYYKFFITKYWEIRGIQQICEGLRKWDPHAIINTNFIFY